MNHHTGCFINRQALGNLGHDGPLNMNIRARFLLLAQQTLTLLLTLKFFGTDAIGRDALRVGVA